MIGVVIGVSNLLWACVSHCCVLLLCSTSVPGNEGSVHQPLSLCASLVILIYWYKLIVLLFLFFLFGASRNQEDSPWKPMLLWWKIMPKWVL